MKKYQSVLGAVPGATKAVDIVAALTPPAKTPGAALVPQKSKMSLTGALTKAAPEIVGGIAGFYLWKKHRWLGAFAGLAAPAVAMSAYHGDYKSAACDAAVVAAGVYGSLKYRKSPVLGFVGGVALGAVATSFVDGSSANRAWKSLRG